MHLKGLAMAPCNPMRCFYKSKDSPLNKLSNDQLHGKELHCLQSKGCIAL